MFLAFREEVRSALRAALQDRDLPADDPGLEEPPADVDAVLASNAAFRLADRRGTAPPAIATELAEAIDTSSFRYLERADASGAYVNFHPAPSYIADTVTAAAGEEDYGALPDRGTSVVVEHTSANPTGPVHVGRARNPIIGDAIARVLDLAGYDVDTHYYVNDAGRQVAVLTWAAERFEESDLPEPPRDRGDYDLVRYYRQGSEFLESADPPAKEAAEAEIQAIIEGLDRGEEATLERVHTVVDRVLDGMTESLSRLPAEFDQFVRETRFMLDGSTDDLVARLQALDAAGEEDGAWQLDLPGFEKNLVFLRSDGTSLYTTRDLAHHEWKLDTYDEAVTVLGEDHTLQADQLTAALELLGAETDRLRTVHYSWVTLPEETMSTRAGTGIDLDDLLDEAIARARDEVESRLDSRLRDDDLDAADLDRIARQVGIGAVRFDVVATQPTKGITFQWDRALDFEAQSAPYVQYVHARCCGILAEADDEVAPESISAGDLTAGAERDLVREVARFPAVVESAAADLEPHQVATYSRRFAETFNGFYRECPVLDAPDEDVAAARLALVTAARHTVGNALGVLGVPAPESM